MTDEQRCSKCNLLFYDQTETEQISEAITITRFTPGHDPIRCTLFDWRCHDIGWQKQVSALLKQISRKLDRP